MTKQYVWRLFKNGELHEVEYHGPHWDEFILNDGPFISIEEAEKFLEEYYEKVNSYYENPESWRFEEFVLLTVYSRN